MTTRQFTILTISFLLASCSKVDKQALKVTLNSIGDTLTVVKTYPSDSIKEIIYYRNNRPVSNIGFYRDGDTIKVPIVVFTKQDNNMFIFIPRALNICSCEFIFGTDSAFAADQESYDKFHKLTDSLHYTSRSIKTSIDLKLDTAIINLGISKGVLKCQMDSECKTFKYYPFDLNRKNYH